MEKNIPSNVEKTMGKVSKTHGKRMGKEWTLDFSAVLSSAQSATNFKVSLLFAKFQFEERYMKVQKPTNIRKYLKNRKKIPSNLEKTMGKASKTHGKRMGKDWKLHFSAVLSSTQ